MSIYIIKRLIVKPACVILLVMWSGHSYASSEGHPLANIQFSQDKGSLQRGALIYYKACRVCHDMKFIRYKNMLDIGFSKAQIDDMRGDRQISDAFTRTINDNVLTKIYGMVPPDLSVMAKARKNGPRYIYTLLTSYSEEEGVYDNALFPGIKMPDIMDISTAVDTTERDEIRRNVKDVSEFLLWASDPHAKERKTTGYFVVAYFIVLSLLLYIIMKRVWGRLDS